MANLSLPVAFDRIFKGPLDSSLIFNSLLEMNDYLSNEARYAGQIVSIVDNNVVQIYQLNATEDGWNQILTAESGVTSVNNETGDVTLDADDIGTSGTTNQFVTQAQLDELHTHSNKAILDGTEESFTTALKNQIGVQTNIDGGTF